MKESSAGVCFGLLWFFFEKMVGATRLSGRA